MTEEQKIKVAELEGKIVEATKVAEAKTAVDTGAAHIKRLEEALAKVEKEVIVHKALMLGGGEQLASKTSSEEIEKILQRIEKRS